MELDEVTETFVLTTGRSAYPRVSCRHVHIITPSASLLISFFISLHDTFADAA